MPTFFHFRKVNDEVRHSGTSAQGYAATMVPITVSLTYINYAVVTVVGALLAVNGHADVASLAHLFQSAVTRH